MAYRALLALPLLGLALSLGCDEPDRLRALDIDELPERFACEDVTVVAAAEDGSEALLLGIEDGLAAAARESDTTIEAAYELPDERLTLRWVAGSNVYQGHCGRDGGGEWRLDDRHEAISGDIAVRVEPEADGSVVVSAVLDGVVLEDPDSPMTYELAPTQIEALRVDP